MVQMVDRLDEGLIPPSCGASTYSLLHDLVAHAIFRTHVEGKLKAEIIRDPARFVGAHWQWPLSLIHSLTGPSWVRNWMCLQCGIQTYAGPCWISVRRCVFDVCNRGCRMLLSVSFVEKPFCQDVS